MLKLRAQFRILHVLKSRQAVRNRAHVAATLHIVLSPQWINAATVAPNVPRQQRKIDQREHIVHSVVMLGDAERPANLRTLGFRISVGGLANHFGGHASLAFGAVQWVFLDVSAVSLESARRMLDELLVGQVRMNNLSRHGVGQRNIASHIKAQPGVRPLRGACPAGIDHMEFRTVANPFQHMMEKNRMRLAGIRTPKENDVRLFDFAIRTGSAARPENRRQTDDARGVSSAVATINVVRANHRANEFLRDVVQLVGGLGTTEHTKRPRPVLFDLRAKSRYHPVESLVPRRGLVRAVRANQRRSQTLAISVIHGLPLLPLPCSFAPIMLLHADKLLFCDRGRAATCCGEAWRFLIRKFFALANDWQGSGTITRRAGRSSGRRVWREARESSTRPAPQRRESPKRWRT